VRRLATDVLRTFSQHDLLTYSSAIAFQVLYAAVPVGLAGLAALGLLGGESLYTHHMADTLRADLSPDAFEIVDRTARRAMTSNRGFWLTVGLLVTLWAAGAAIRSMMTALNATYGTTEHRSWHNRLLLSIGVGALVTACVCAALLAVLGGRLVHPDGVPRPLVDFVRWGVALAFLGAANAMVIRFVPATNRPVQWVSVGSLLSILCWLVATIAFGAWVSFVPYSSVYGALATVVLLLMYFHIAAVAFLLGVVVDSALRDEVRDRRVDQRERQIDERSSPYTG
jgi:membrane protein